MVFVIAEDLLFPSDPMHYRLRSSNGFLNMQKVSKSWRLFLTKGTSKTDNIVLFVKIMTQILQNYFQPGLKKWKGPKSDKRPENPEGGLRLFVVTV